MRKPRLTKIQNPAFKLQRLRKDQWLLRTEWEERLTTKSTKNWGKWWNCSISQWWLPHGWMHLSKLIELNSKEWIVQHNVSRSVMLDSLRLMGCSPPGSSVHGILQARILEWVAIPFSRGSSQPRDWTQVSHTVGKFFTTKPPGKPVQHKIYLNKPDCKSLVFDHTVG